MPLEFKLPELGENVEKGDVVRVLVAVGDVVKAEQPVLELETDKATIEVPSSVAGKVTAIKVKAGDKVKVGQVVLELEEGAAESAAPKAEPAAAPAAAKEAPAPAAKSEAPTASPEPAKAPAKTADVVDISSGRPAPAAAPSRQEAPAAAASAAPALEPAGDSGSVPAAPSVRRFARELGVDIARVPGTGPGGRIGQDDVKEHVKATLQSPARAGGGARVAQPALPDFTKWGEVDVKPMSNIRRKTAEHLAAAWQAPHVTQNDHADMTAVEAFRKTFGPRVEKAGGKLTTTAKVKEAAVEA